MSPSLLPPPICPSWAGPSPASRPALVGLLGLALLACGAGSSGDGVDATCASSAECGAGLVCEGQACVAPSEAMVDTSLGPESCRVLSCPEGVASCCRAATASAVASEADDYVTRLDLVDAISMVRGEVRASFDFTEAGQQGWVAFDLGTELNLERVGFIGRYEGATDRFLTLSVNRREGEGCAFGLELEAQPAPLGSVAPFVLGSDVSLMESDFCYHDGVPGRASELVFGIFATSAGRASLVISGVTLTPD